MTSKTLSKSKQTRSQNEARKYDENLFENGSEMGSLGEPCAAQGPPLDGLGASWVALGRPWGAYGWPTMAPGGVASEIQTFASIFRPISTGPGDDFDTIFRTFASIFRPISTSPGDDFDTIF